MIKTSIAKKVARKLSFYELLQLRGFTRIVARDSLNPVAAERAKRDYTIQTRVLREKEIQILSGRK